MHSLLAYLPLLACGASAATIWKCFKELDAISKPQFKRMVARAITSSSIFTVGTMLPSLCLSAFDGIFTDNLWSRRGFIRSCIASLVTVTILLVVWYSTIPNIWNVRFAALGITGHPEAPRWWTLIAIPHFTNVPFNIDISPEGVFRTIPGDILSRHGGTLYASVNMVGIKVFGGLPFIYNLLVDFGTLIATRQIFRRISEKPSANMWRLIIIFLVSACGILALSFVALDIAVVISNYIVSGASPSTPAEWIFSPSRFMGAILFPFYRSDPQRWQIDTIYGVFVWSTLMGILWLGIFCASVIIANASMKLRGVGPWLNKNFQVQRQPMRILRALAIIVLSGVCVIYHLWAAMA
jgi:hypothetical protein